MTLEPANNPRRRSEHRELVLGCLSSAGGRHMTAEQVHEEVRKDHPGIGIATVYRNLKQLEESGDVIRSVVGDAGTAVYEPAGPSGRHLHHHLICFSCGSVQDLDADLLDAIERHVEDKKGFKVKDHRLHIYGICRHCSREEAEGQG